MAIVAIMSHTGLWNLTPIMKLDMVSGNEDDDAV